MNRRFFSHIVLASIMTLAGGLLSACDGNTPAENVPATLTAGADNLFASITATANAQALPRGADARHRKVELRGRAKGQCEQHD